MSVFEKFMGDVTGMINSKRGAIEEMGERGEAKVITSKVPLAELFGFTTQLRSATDLPAEASAQVGGRGVPNVEFSHYAVVVYITALLRRRGGGSMTS